MAKKPSTRINLILPLFVLLFAVSSNVYGHQFTAIENQRIIKPQKDVLSRNESRLLQYDNLILTTSERHNIDPALVKAIILAESSIDTDAVSKNGAQGLMQLMPETAKSLGVKNSTHPEQNIEAGTKYLKCLIDDYNGNIKIALAAYNAGAGTVKRYNGIPPYEGTRSFIKKVLAYYNIYKVKDDG
jgi:soluble lytic murein transglycosylase-like protein